ncbi:uncharacterized protein BYT42DRAFT_301840 [Radiomyces spectabilis]|uniref:uncharacterized protein n=1 Tax=Radiomyces spectabilis TaxID=64574 RepID=UPI00221F919C|nr:uncharacterized protein BYT42DRAFT_301840 [Radiomyces spectabilis]KAI8381340.1 hypothetical protein BYT42DRAFT_301840 [Radiomyces spectabilis]
MLHLNYVNISSSSPPTFTRHMNGCESLSSQDYASLSRKRSVTDAFPDDSYDHESYKVPKYKSNLSTDERSFVDFTRCLYRAKAVVNDLRTFSAAVCPAPHIAYHHDPLHPHSHYHNMIHQQYAEGRFSNSLISSDQFLRHINQYMSENYHKFTQMCKFLLLVLRKLESTSPLRQICIDSFRKDIYDELKVASEIYAEFTACTRMLNVGQSSSSSSSLLEQQPYPSSSTGGEEGQSPIASPVTESDFECEIHSEPSNSSPQL